MRNLSELNCVNKRILIFSPHPDDDCIGMGSTIFILSQNKNRIKIAYMTSGWRGVGGNLSISDKKLLRKKEAIKACCILGVAKKSIKFLDLPFYDKRKISNEDTNLVRAEIKKFKPDIIFVCGESNDPHQTHGACLKIIVEALLKLKFSPQVLFYRVWKEFKFDDINFFLPFRKKLMEKKIEAIQVHKSQLTSLFTKWRIKSFWQREKRLNKKFALILRKKGLLKGGNFLFCEVFKTCPGNPEKYPNLWDKERDIN